MYKHVKKCKKNVHAKDAVPPQNDDIDHDDIEEEKDEVRHELRGEDSASNAHEDNEDANDGQDDFQADRTHDLLVKDFLRNTIQRVDFDRNVQDMEAQLRETVREADKRNAIDITKMLIELTDK